APALEALASAGSSECKRAGMSRATQRLRRDPRAWIGIGVVTLLVLMALAAPLIAGHDPLAIDLVRSLEGPSRSHCFGTDIQGRDVFARLVYGARVSLTVGIASQLIALSLGVMLGLIAGYYGKWIDEIVIRLADSPQGFPTQWPPM